MCNCARILKVSAKCSDLCYIEYQNLVNEKSVEHDGYVPKGLGIGGGDYVEFSLCMDCGKIAGEFPVYEETILDSL